MGAVGGARDEAPPGLHRYALFTHVFGDRVLAHAHARLLQLHRDPWAAVGAAAVLMNLADPLHQLLATFLPRAGGTIPPGVVAAAGNLQDAAHHLHRELPCSSADEVETPVFRLAK